MLINAAVGGMPGKDCGGFCKFCYFKGADFNNIDSLTIGCRYCPPNKIGCDYCHRAFNNIGFKSPSHVLLDLENILRWHDVLGTLNYKDLKIVTASSADIMMYPQLLELISALKDWRLYVHLGYTSAKGVKDEKLVEEMISLGLNEASISVFSTNPEMRREWMNDKTPEQSLKAIKILCENIDVNASTVVIPDVINEEEIFRTCSDLEDWGVKTFMLSRFANIKREGLILNNKPLINGIHTQLYEEFQEMVKNVSEEFSFRVIGAPFNDPKKGLPYTLSKKENRKYLKNLPEVTNDATIITSKLSFKPLKKIFDFISEDKVNVIGVDKEIGDLITHEDLAMVNLDEVKKRVIIPGGALVHDRLANEILNKDGKERHIVRGPTGLFYYDIEELSKDEIIKFELERFTSLINKINSI